MCTVNSKILYKSLMLILSLLLHNLKEQQITPENYDDAITAGLRHCTTGLFLLNISTGFNIKYLHAY